MPLIRLRTPLPIRARARAFASAALVNALIVFGSLVSCVNSSDLRTISGELHQGIECLVLRTGQTTYEITNWPGFASPPVGAFVRLRVKPVEGVSFCMVGPMVQVIRVLEVRRDFRTEPVTTNETWRRGERVVLGAVTVVEGATLTIEPGADVRFAPYGVLLVRGSIVMQGAPGDSVRLSGREGAEEWGVVQLDSAQAVSIAYAVIPAVEVRGEGGALRHVRVASVSASEGVVNVRDQSSVGGVTVFGGSFTLEQSRLRAASVFHGSIEATGSFIGRIDLSYSNANVTGCTFEGPRTDLIFHGSSSGAFEENVFASDVTVIEVRHDSHPVFHRNDLVSPTTVVSCESYLGPQCIAMEDNWWGTSDQGTIGTKVCGSVCFVPFRTSPVGGGLALR